MNAVKSNQNQKLESKKSNKKIKIFVLISAIAITVLFFLILVLSLLISNDQETDEIILPTSSPVPSLTPKATQRPSSTPSLAPSTMLLNNYLLSDCEVRLRAKRDLWKSAVKGTLSTCGLFYSGELDEFSKPEDYDGLMIAFLENKEGSILALPKGVNLKQFLDKTAKTQSSSIQNKDILLRERSFILGGRELLNIEVERFDLGRIGYIEYTVNGVNYLVAYGGKDLDSQRSELELLLKSVEYLIPPDEIIL